MDWITCCQVVNDQAMALAPAAGVIEVQCFLVLVWLVAGMGGFGLVDPLHGDQQPLREEMLLLGRILRLQYGAVWAQHLSNGSLTLPDVTKTAYKSPNV